MKKFLIINLLSLLIVTTFLNTANASIETEDSLSTNINKVNSLLHNQMDTTNPNYLTEIVDENGNVPAYESYTNHINSRFIKELKAYDGKIFMGLGDWNDNTGPVKIVYYDTTDGKIKTSGTIDDEAIQKFNIIDDKLYTTGCDPKDNWGYGSYYIYNKEENKWDKHLKNDGWIHVFNIVKFKEKLFMCGSTVDTMETSSIQSSSDNGATFESVPVYKNDTILPYNSSLRCYNLAVYNGKLYGYIGYESYAGIYEYDEKNNRFDYISTRPYGLSYNNTYFEYTIFNNQFIYISGIRLYTSKDLKTFTPIADNTGYNIKDAVVHGDTLYTLSYKKYSYNKYNVIIYSTKDLSEFKPIYEFKTNVEPFSLEYYDNSLYIGTTSSDSDDNKQYDFTANPVNVSTDSGALFRINLKDAKRSIDINTDEKTIEISDNGETYNVDYDISSESAVFKTTLTFNNTMNKEQFKEEYSNIRNLNLIFGAIANGQDVGLDSSTQYFNNVLSKNISSSSQEFTNAVKYAKEMFDEGLNIKDDLFMLTTSKISENEDEYKTEVTLTISNNVNFDSIKDSNPNDSSNNNNNSTDKNVNINTNNGNSTVNNYINNNKLPQTGERFELKHLLKIVIVISILFIAILVTGENKHNKTNKKQ